MDFHNPRTAGIVAFAVKARDAADVVDPFTAYITAVPADPDLSKLRKKLQDLRRGSKTHTHGPYARSSFNTYKSSLSNDQFKNKLIVKLQETNRTLRINNLHKSVESQSTREKLDFALSKMGSLRQKVAI